MTDTRKNLLVAGLTILACGVVLFAALSMVTFAKYPIPSDEFMGQRRSITIGMKRSEVEGFLKGYTSTVTDGTRKRYIMEPSAGYRVYPLLKLLIIVDYGDNGVVKSVDTADL